MIHAHIAVRSLFVKTVLIRNRICCPVQTFHASPKTKPGIVWATATYEYQGGNIILYYIILYYIILYYIILYYIILYYIILYNTVKIIMWMTNNNKTSSRSLVGMLA